MEVEHAVALGEMGEPVGHQKQGAILPVAPDDVENLGFCPLIHSGEGIVEDDDRPGVGEGAREGEPGLLPAGEHPAAGTHRAVWRAAHGREIPVHRGALQKDVRVDGVA